MSTEGEVTFILNGREVRLEVPARTSLADALRDHLSLTGTHVGCEHGVCGACTVLLDGQPVRGYLLFALQVEGASVTTIEGLHGEAGRLHPVQEAFHECHALQCGFNLCMCTGYQNIVRAARMAARRLHRPARKRGTDRARIRPVHVTTTTTGASGRLRKPGAERLKDVHVKPRKSLTSGRDGADQGGEASIAASHGSFDNDVAIMSRTLKRILGLRPTPRCRCRSTAFAGSEGRGQPGAVSGSGRSGTWRTRTDSGPGTSCGSCGGSGWRRWPRTRP